MPIFLNRRPAGPALLGLISLLALLAAGCGGGGGGSTSSNGYFFVPQGGDVIPSVSSGNTIQFHYASGSVSQSYQVNVSDNAAVPSDPTGLTGSPKAAYSVSLSPSALQFGAPATVYLNIPGATASDRIFEYTGGAWVELPQPALGSNGVNATLAGTVQKIDAASGAAYFAVFTLSPPAQPSARL